MHYLFVDCLLDTQLCTLYRAGQAIPLRPKAFHVLRYLLEHCDHPVPKEELCAHVWPDQFISDATIEGCIKCVRQAIGDTGRKQQLIHTRRGYGYRFVGSLTEQRESATTSIPRPPDPARLPEEKSLASNADAVSSTPRSPLAHRPAPEFPGHGMPGGERKLVTLLGCALAEATSVQAQPALDALHGRMRTLFTLTQEMVGRYGGVIHHVAGTRLLALFGAPLAQEDHARRALLAAWGLHQRLKALRDMAEEPLAVCLGLHTGLMVVGEIGEAHGAAIVGDLTLMIEALHEHAAPGILLCTGAAARLIRKDVHLNEVTSVPMRGQSPPVRTYEVVRLRSEDAAGVPLERRPRSPFVGRTHELATLQAAFAHAIEGRGQVVGIVGEPGIGKSRLLTEWRQQLPAPGVTILESRCLSYGSATPYLPLLDLLRAQCGITPADGAVAITAKVTGTLQAGGLAPDTDGPCLLHLLGIEAATAQLAGINPDTLKARTFATLRQLWLKSSQKRPLIVVVEDMHWIDPTSEEFLASLVQGLSGAAVLVVGTYRPGYRPPWLEKSYATQLSVRPLSAQDSVQVVQAVLQQQTVLPRVAEALFAKAQGNPFFLEELAQTLVEEGVLEGEASRLTRSSSSMTDLRLPPTVHAVLAARVDRLSLEAKCLLQTAAVIGIDVPLPLLHAIAELPAAALYCGLAHLQAAEFLYETHGLTEPAYRFKHALTQEVAYGSLLLERRRVLHGRIVEALETLTPERVAERPSGTKGFPAGSLELDQVNHMAHHALAGAVWDKALLYCRQAGHKAMARSAHHEAVRYFEQALHALAHLPQTHDTREQAIDLRLSLRSALHPTGDLGRAKAYLEEAEILAAALGDPRRLGHVSVYLSLHLYLMGAYDEAIGAALRALALASASGDVALQRLANLHLGIAYQTQADYRRAIHCLSQTLTTADSHERSGEYILAVFTPAYLAACHAELGTFAEGGFVADQGLRIAEAVDHPMSLTFALWGSGLLALRQGDISRAVTLLERAVRLCEEMGRPASFPLMAAALGATYNVAGRSADAMMLLAPALEQAMGSEVIVNQASCSLTLSEAQMMVGLLEEAQVLAEGALSVARMHHERGNEAYALYLHGELAVRREPLDWALAADHYQQALVLAEELGMRPLQAHCHHGLGRLYRQTGRGAQTHAALAIAITLYRTMDMTFWLSQAEAALASERSGASAPDPRSVVSVAF